MLNPLFLQLNYAWNVFVLLLHICISPDQSFTIDVERQYVLLPLVTACYK